LWAYLSNTKEICHVIVTLLTQIEAKYFHWIAKKVYNEYFDSMLSKMIVALRYFHDTVKLKDKGLLQYLYQNNGKIE
jgi:hypothetical protein